MNKKVLGIAVALMFVAMLIAPVMAKGPIKAADKNKNVDIITGSGPFIVDLSAPSEVINRWFGASSVHIIVKPADKFYNPTELDVGDNFMMWLTNDDYRAKWVHMNKGEYLPFPMGTGYLGLFAMFGLPEPTGVPDTEGVYIWGGKT